MNNQTTEPTFSFQQLEEILEKTQDFFFNTTLHLGIDLDEEFISPAELKKMIEAAVHLALEGHIELSPARKISNIAA